MESVAHLRLRGSDRRQKSRFVVWDRRSGFERRAVRRSRAGAVLEANLVYLRDHPPVVLSLLVLGNLLSLVDLMLTNVALSLGATEVNPFMLYFLEMGTTEAAVVKCGVLVVASAGIWLMRRRRVALLAAPLFVAVYTTVVIYELIGISLLL